MEEGGEASTVTEVMDQNYIQQFLQDLHYWHRCMGCFEESEWIYKGCGHFFCSKCYSKGDCVCKSGQIALKWNKDPEEMTFVSDVMNIPSKVIVGDNFDLVELVKEPSALLRRGQRKRVSRITYSPIDKLKTPKSRIDESAQSLNDNDEVGNEIDTGRPKRNAGGRTEKTIPESGLKEQTVRSSARSKDKSNSNIKKESLIMTNGRSARKKKLESVIQPSITPEKKSRPGKKVGITTPKNNPDRISDTVSETVKTNTPPGDNIEEFATPVRRPQRRKSVMVTPSSLKCSPSTPVVSKAKKKRIVGAPVSGTPKMTQSPHSSSPQLSNVNKRTPVSGTPKTTQSPHSSSPQLSKINKRTPVSGTPKMTQSPHSSSPQLSKINKRGESALHLICKTSSLAQVRELLEAGADPNAQDYAMWTPLHEAVVTGIVPCIKTLLDNGSLVNAPGLNLRTPLHIAVRRNDIPTIKVLLEYGADPLARDMEGVTPRCIAKLIGFEETISLLSAEKIEVPEFIPKIRELVLFDVDLSAKEKSVLKDFARLYNVKIEPKNIFKATHFIVPLDKELSQQEWSLTRAMAKGAHIIRSNWLLDSIAAKFIVDYTSYEVFPDWLPGLSAAQKNKCLLRPGLFSGCHVVIRGGKADKLLIDGEQVPISDISEFVLNADGVVLKRMCDPEDPTLNKTVLFHADPDGPFKNCSYIVVYMEGVSDVPIKYNMSHYKCLPFSWFLQAIRSFKLMPLQEVLPV